MIASGLRNQNLKLKNGNLDWIHNAILSGEKKEKEI